MRFIDLNGFNTRRSNISVADKSEAVDIHWRLNNLKFKGMFTRCDINAGCLMVEVCSPVGNAGNIPLVNYFLINI